MYLWDKHGTSPKGLAFPEDFQAAHEAGLAIAGTADEVRDWLQDHVERTGVNYLACRFAFGDLTHAEALRSVELFAAQVMPAFRSEVVA